MTDTAHKISPYLVRPRRGLREACRKIAGDHGETRPPCAACGLADLCAVSRSELPPLPEPEHRQKAAE